MEDKDLEKLFKEDLNRLRNFSNADGQWELVQDRLRSKRTKGFPFWFLSIGLLLIAVFFFWANVDVVPESNAVSYHHEVIESSNTFDKAVPLAHENDGQDVVSIGAVDQSDNGNLFDESITTIINQNSDSQKTDEIEKKTSVIEESIATRVKSTLAKNDLSQGSKLIKDDCVICDEEATANEKHLITAKPEKEEEEYYMTKKKVLRPMMSLLDMLSLRETRLKRDLVTQKLSAAPLEFKSKVQPNYSFKLSAGARGDYLLDKMIEDNSKWRPYFGVGVVHRSGLGLDVRYSWGQIERNILGNFASYKIPIVSYEPEPPNNTKIDFTNRSIDLDVNMSLYKLRGLGFDILGGVQFNDYNRSNITYYYNGNYQIYIIEDVLPDSGWSCTDVSIGSRISYPIFSKFGLVGQYQYHIPIGNSYNWGNRHRFFVGINYTVNKN